MTWSVISFNYHLIQTALVHYYVHDEVSVG